jgi:pyruvate/2-oxoglutarate/acetoin dehydrogenase E1 component/TPP-dependent pyruvate/acetoin dehydrogenase alpha subunit
MNHIDDIYSTLGLSRNDILNDYYTACVSRTMSRLGRREVLSGKAKFGIFADGMELPQLAMARVFRHGDFRSGYYRDQTLMVALGILTPQQMFAALYADTDIEAEPASSGRQMVGHFSTHLVDKDGEWIKTTDKYNSSSDMSCTSGQMPRGLGLALASQKYERLPLLAQKNSQLTQGGKEITFINIGNAAAAEGAFFEVMNTIAIRQLPAIVSVYDNDYGISVTNDIEMAKGSVSRALKGLETEDAAKGIHIIEVCGWDYASLIEAYREAEDYTRNKRIPTLVHVVGLTQPYAHSTSGSHERYKSSERLAWEASHDCNARFAKWIVENGIASQEELKDIESRSEQAVKDGRKRALDSYEAPIKKEYSRLLPLVKAVMTVSTHREEIQQMIDEAARETLITRRRGISLARRVLILTAKENIAQKSDIKAWLEDTLKENDERYASHLYSPRDKIGTEAIKVAPQYDNNATEVDGRVILRDNFHLLFEKHHNLFAFGEDVGRMGDVNQGMEGLQKTFGEERVFDTGIRETSIIGEAMGMAMRGLRPIAEIQYLDYIIYALTVMSDDVATLSHRTRGTQKAPVIVRTRGHRLEGIWHSGSQMGGLLGLLRGMYILTPRDMTRAAGFYNTLMECDTPALVVENLLSYRKKELLPANLSEIRTPIGVAEVVREGRDVTMVSYGTAFSFASIACEKLSQMGIDVELIDPQSLLPFDMTGVIGESLKKTSRLVVVDEDVKGGASAYMLENILTTQGGYNYLDSAPVCVTAREHRPTYADDGDYHAKPQVDDIMEAVIAMMHEAYPCKF